MNVRHDMVTVFVVRPDASGASHEFLYMRRAATAYMGGTWAVVRGGVNAGEPYLDAALRELREETGLRPRELYRLGSIESFYTLQHDALWHSVPFCAIVARGDEVRLNREHDGYKWVGREHVIGQSMRASERLVLRDVLQDILDDGVAKPHLRIPPGPA